MSSLSSLITPFHRNALCPTSEIRFEEAQSRTFKTNEVLEEGAQDRVVHSVESSRQVQKNKTHTMAFVHNTDNFIMDMNEGSLSVGSFL